MKFTKQLCVVLNRIDRRSQECQSNHTERPRNQYSLIGQTRRSWRHNQYVGLDHAQSPVSGFLRQTTRTWESRNIELDIEFEFEFEFEFELDFELKQIQK